MDVAEVSMMYIIYVSSEMLWTKDTKENKSKGSTRNHPTNVVS